MTRRTEKRLAHRRRWILTATTGTIFLLLCTGLSGPRRLGDAGNLTQAQARELIASNKIAIVLGVENSTAKENRDDGAPREKTDEKVAIGRARQMAPMKKFQNKSKAVLNNAGWDINLDGMPHIGLYPDFLQDVRNVGVSWEYMTPLFNAAEEYVRMWEQQCELAKEVGPALRDYDLRALSNTLAIVALRPHPT
jgi:hypothetical protein